VAIVRTASTTTVFGDLAGILRVFFVATDDGVLWATLGQQPDVQGELTRLYAALTGARPSFVSVEDAAQTTNDLKTILERIVERGTQSVQRTPDLLPILK
jgi:hypothetical protein